MLFASVQTQLKFDCFCYYDSTQGQRSNGNGKDEGVKYFSDEFYRIDLNKQHFTCRLHRVKSCIEHRETIFLDAIGKKSISISIDPVFLSATIDSFIVNAKEHHTTLFKIEFIF